MRVDYLVVGSGLTGAVIARILTDMGREVLVVERRPHIGGNVHDYTHVSGIRVHTYGPHYFRTSSKRIWAFVNRFASFDKYEAVVQSCVDDCYENWPVTASYIRRQIGESWEPEFEGTPTNFEEAALRLMPRLVYERFVKGYTEKQWGRPAHTLSVNLVRRLNIREGSDFRLRQSKYQGIPNDGYASFMRNMLKGIPTILNFDYLHHRNFIKVRKLLVFTGPIDEFFGFTLGHLAYRGQQRKHTYLSNVDYALPCGQVNNPSLDGGLHIRTVEWKHMMPRQYADRIRGTILTKEIPFSPTTPDDYEYPFPDKINACLYKRYRKYAGKIPDLLICGRLGEYRYYDMDQAIDRAMTLMQRFLG